jgi:hypothetical protein
MLVDLKPGLVAVMHVQASTRTAIYEPMERMQTSKS